MSRKILIITGDGGDSLEVLYAYHRFLEAEWIPVVAAPSRRRLHTVLHDFEPGWETYVERTGYTVEADIAITAASAREFEIILVIGGRAPEYLRNDASLLSLLREFKRLEKWICAIGHGVQVLAAADILVNRALTCHPHVRIEVESAGGRYVNKPAVRDGKLITAQTWRAHPEFYRELFAALS